MSVVTSVIDGGKERKASHVCHSYNVYLSERHRKAEAEFLREHDKPSSQTLNCEMKTIQE